MKKLILSLVFVLATGLIVSSNQIGKNNELGGSCFDMANGTENNYCGSAGCNDRVWVAAYDACRSQFLSN